MPMIKTSTTNELIRFLYQESSKNEETNINKSLIADDNLQEEAFGLSDVINKIDNLTIEAPQRAVDKIKATLASRDMESA